MPTENPVSAPNSPLATTVDKISAILTKYTALRTYQELSNKGTPLDYENAGVYTSALLDAYMDYKAIWKLIQLGKCGEPRLEVPYLLLSVV